MIFQFSLPLPVHSVTLRALSWKDIFAQSAAAFHVFQGRGSCSGNRRGGEPQPGQCWALLSAGPCSVPQAKAVGRGERFLLVLLMKVQLAFFPITLFL